jgi:hypothetical protein
VVVGTVGLILLMVTALAVLALRGNNGRDAQARGGATPSLSNVSGQPTPGASGDAPASGQPAGGNATKPGSSVSTAGAGAQPGGATGGSSPRPSDGGGAVAQPPLTAEYTTTTSGKTYDASVTITNPGSRPVASWTVTLTFRAQSQSVTNVSGASVSKSGKTWTFVPAGTGGTVPAGGSVRISFQVTGAGGQQPVGCTVDGQPCGGL